MGLLSNGLVANLRSSTFSKIKSFHLLNIDPLVAPVVLSKNLRCASSALLMAVWKSSRLQSETLPKTELWDGSVRYQHDGIYGRGSMA